MSKQAHTPGPWVISSSILVCTSEAKIVATCKPLPLEEIAPSFEECKANARLIAAAPELLEALKLTEELENVADESEYDRLSSMALKARQRAIAKAEGRS